MIALDTSTPPPPYRQYTNARAKFYPSMTVMQVSSCDIFPVEQQPPPGNDSPLLDCKPPGRPTSTPGPFAPPKDPARAMEESKRRARAKIHDIAMLNPFSYFFTWTLNGSLLDRYNAEQVSKTTQTFLRNATRRKGFQYVLVPEYHKG